MVSLKVCTFITVFFFIFTGISVSAPVPTTLNESLYNNCINDLEAAGFDVVNKNLELNRYNAGRPELFGDAFGISGYSIDPIINVSQAAKEYAPKVMWAILCLPLGLYLSHWYELDGTHWIVVDVLVVVMILQLVSIALQPMSKTPVAFKVPFVPLTPALSIFINIYLMFFFDVYTWIKFIIWMVVGFTIYFGYGITHSKENEQEINIINPNQSKSSLNKH